MNKKLLYFISFVFIFGLAGSCYATYGVQTKTSGCLADQILPDSSCTPGAVLTTDLKTICKVGYTKTVRSVSDATKKKVFAEYGIAWSQHSNYEVDHLISLELGGGNNISNLWPENSTISYGSFSKDKLENYLHNQICSGKMTVAEAQAQISGKWVLNYFLAFPIIKQKQVYVVAPATPKPVTTTQLITQPITQTQTVVPVVVPVPVPVVTQTPASTPTPAPTIAPTTVPASTPTPTITPSPAPVQTPVTSNHSGATGKCKDGTETFSTSHSGACSHHGGVEAWY